MEGSFIKICYLNELRFLLRRDEGVHCGEHVARRNKNRVELNPTETLEFRKIPLNPY